MQGVRRGCRGQNLRMPTSTATSPKQAAQEAADSKPIEWAARLGLVARGMIWLTIGLLALQIALGSGGGEEADRHGALRAIADKPLGHSTLVALLIGFVGYAVWRLLEAAVGHRKDDGATRVGKRLLSFGRAGLYTAFSYTTVKFLAGGGSNGGSSGSDHTKPFTARVMSHTGGQLIVGAVGSAIIIGSLIVVVQALRGKFLDKLEDQATTIERITATVGRTGLIVRGLVFALIGWFVLHSAIEYDPEKARGLDDSLRTLADQPFGPALLTIAAIGLLSFALWSFLEAWQRRI